jgi:VIT1/CCC1 family predicted Fe2+/Mn2+ transporter
VPTIDLRQSAANLRLERDAIALYDALARIERDPMRAQAFRKIAENERRHADIWAEKLRNLGAPVPPASGPRMRVRFIVLVARVFGTHAVRDLVQALEGDEEEAYTAQASPEVESIAADEREHAEIWRRLSAGRGMVGDATSGPGGRETWHRAGRSGTLRAVIFGVSDGLVSNLSLVMGVAGASSGEAHFILLAGIAGLLAGSFSMAAGEYISMQSQRELFERQIALERAELAAIPEEEETELAMIYRRKGFSDEESRSIAHRLIGDPEAALDTLVREELGLDPQQLGSPWGAATGSFLAFALGAIVPVLPYVFLRESSAFVLSLALSLVALFVVGAGVSLLTGRSLLLSGLRQSAIGGAAAAVTYAVGAFIGVAVGG